MAQREDPLETDCVNVFIITFRDCKGASVVPKRAPTDLPAKLPPPTAFQWHPRRAAGIYILLELVIEDRLCMFCIHQAYDTDITMAAFTGEQAPNAPRWRSPMLGKPVEWFWSPPRTGC